MAVNRIKGEVQSSCMQATTKQDSKTPSNCYTAAAASNTKYNNNNTSSKRACFRPTLVRLLPLIEIAFAIVLLDMCGHQNSAVAMPAASIESQDLLQKMYETGDSDTSISSFDDISLQQARLRKRHANHIDLHAATSSAEWQNPCRGYYEPESQETARLQRPPPEFYLKKMRRYLGIEFNSMKKNLKAIDIGDIKMYKRHDNFYRFLPRIRPHSRLNLALWHHNIQIYIAYFAALERTQRSHDLRTLMYVSDITNELKELRDSARMVLCEIETTFNGSAAHSSNDNNNDEEQLTTIDHVAMNELLQFNGYQRNNWKFAKYHYFRTLAKIVKILRAQKQRAAMQTQLQSSAEEQNLSASLADVNLSESAEVSEDEASVETRGSARRAHRNRQRHRGHRKVTHE